MTHRTRHVMSPPIEEAEEIPYDPVIKAPRNLRIEIKFDGDEIDRLKAGTPRPVNLHGWMKRAILEAADREAAAKSGEGLRAAD